ncbi:MAG: FHA domain-containing protein [Deinococcales bacterium]
MLRLRFADGREVPVSQQMLVGRAQDCDLVLLDPSVSSRHALLEYSAGQLFVTDLGSTNGTFVAGQPVSGRVQVVWC